VYLKHIAAILLMGILFFNWYGYQLVGSLLQDRANHGLEARLDENKYDESQLISVRVPLTTLSYYNSSTQFERVDGQVEFGGVQYKYVKRRIFKDSLELLCIPNQAAMGLQTAKNNFFQQVNDLQQHNSQGKKSNSGASKNFSSTDYYKTDGLFAMGTLFSIELPQSFQPAPVVTSSYVLTAEQPPDLLSAHC
jgi:hypothetical protein